MNEDKIRAIIERHTAEHLSFVYVKRKDRSEPRLFHRPSCRANSVSKPTHIAMLFDSAEEALTRGLVPCKRCKPGDNRLANLPPKRKVWNVCRYFLKRPNSPWEAALNKHGFAKHHGHRTFKKHVGMTPVDFQRLVHISRNEARQLCMSLNEGDGTESTNESTVLSGDHDTNQEMPSYNEGEKELADKVNCYMNAYTEPHIALYPLRLPSPFTPSAPISPMRSQFEFELYNKTDFDELFLSFTPPLTPASDSTTNTHADIDSISPFRIDRFSDLTTLVSTEWHSKEPAWLGAVSDEM